MPAISQNTGLPIRLGRRSSGVRWAADMILAVLCAIAAAVAVHLIANLF